MLLLVETLNKAKGKFLKFSLLPIYILIFIGCEEKLPESIYLSSESELTQLEETESSISITSQSNEQVQTVIAQEQKTTERVNLAEGQVSFVPPPGFTPMTSEEIALKFPYRTGNQPQYVYANEPRSVAIAITFSESQVSPEQLSELKNFMEQYIETTIPNIKWITRNFATINNQRWVRLEFISPAIDPDIRNDTYLTSFNGKMLGFNFNSTVEKYNEISAELHKSRDSIRINQ